jgi:exodeoxyribonuclease V alpha subunit
MGRSPATDDGLLTTDRRCLMQDLFTPQPAERLGGFVERVTFHSQDSGFCVLRVKVKGHRELVTVVGTLAEVRAGEWLEAEGAWTVDPKHGQQFRAATLRTAPPSTLDGIERYLASGMIKGIGPHLAKQLVARFGLEVFEIIEKHPKRLREVEGIGTGRQKMITSAWHDQRIVRDIMVFLQGHGVTTSRAFRIYKTYGEQAIQKVKEDPYRLARDIWGIGFKTADSIAASMGIDKESPRRAEAGIEYVLQELTTEGHCAFPRDKLIDKTAELLEIPREIVDKAIETILAEGRLKQELCQGETLVYLSWMYEAERRLAMHLVEQCGGDHPCPSVDAAKAIEWVEARIGLTLADGQRDAVRQALASKVLVITGGPGTGKTTLVNAILKIHQVKKLRVVLCAPTGRAAKRLTETSGCEAKTIHRLLEVDPATGQFKHDGRNPLEGDLFVIDETSMVDIMLAHYTIQAIPPKAALLIVGDVDQLPSVGPGCVLRDIIDSGAVPVCRLTQVFRQAAQSAIITNAHRVNHGEMPVFPRGRVQDPASTDCYFVQAEEPERAVEVIVKMVRESIPQRFGLRSMDDIQVLTPMHRAELGARNLNLVLQAALNPTGPSIQKFGWTFRAGDKVMQLVNDYDKDVFNGDIGRIVSIDEHDQQLVVRFEGREVTYDPGELDELSLAYATTVHKSQGSEYPAVIVPVHTQHYMLLQRNLLYTALTRAKRLLVVVGSAKALAIAVKRAEAGKRITMLKERLIEFRTTRP